MPACVDAARKGEIARVAQRYAVAVTPAMLDAIDPHDPADPIARQFVPTSRRADDDAGRAAPTRSAMRRIRR